MFAAAVVFPGKIAAHGDIEVAHGKNIGSVAFDIDLTHPVLPYLIVDRSISLGADFGAIGAALADRLDQTSGQLAAMHAFEILLH